MNEVLEEKVEERTRSLANKNKKLEEYAFTNAHELRAPVATILGLLQFFDCDTMSECEAQGLIKKLKEASYKLDNVVISIRKRLEDE